MFFTPRLYCLVGYLSFIPKLIHLLIYSASKILSEHLLDFQQMLLATIIREHLEQMLLDGVENS